MESYYLRFFLFLFFYFSLWKEIKGVNFAPFSFFPPPLPSFWIRFIARWLGFFSIRRNESLYFQWNVRTQPSLMLLTTAYNRIYICFLYRCRNTRILKNTYDSQYPWDAELILFLCGGWVGKLLALHRKLSLGSISRFVGNERSLPRHSYYPIFFLN